MAANNTSAHKACWVTLGPLALTTRVSCIVTWPLVPGTSWLHCPPVQHIFPPLLLRLLYREFLFGRLSRYGWSKSPEGTDPKIRKRAGQLSELYTKVLRSAVDLEEILCPVRHRVLKWKCRKNYFSKIVFIDWLEQPVWNKIMALVYERVSQSCAELSSAAPKRGLASLAGHTLL